MGLWRFGMEEKKPMMWVMLYEMMGEIK